MYYIIVTLCRMRYLYINIENKNSSKFEHFYYLHSRYLTFKRGTYIKRMFVNLYSNENSMYRDF